MRCRRRRGRSCHRSRVPAPCAGKRWGNAAHAKTCSSWYVPPGLECRHSEHVLPRLCFPPLRTMMQPSGRLAASRRAQRSKAVVEHHSQFVAEHTHWPAATSNEKTVTRHSLGLWFRYPWQLQSPRKSASHRVILRDVAAAPAGLDMTEPLCMAPRSEERRGGKE